MAHNKSKKTQSQKATGTMGNNKPKATSNQPKAPDANASNGDINRSMNGLSLQAPTDTANPDQPAPFSRNARRRANQKLNAAVVNSGVVGSSVVGDVMPDRVAAAIARANDERAVAAMAGPSRQSVQGFARGRTNLPASIHTSQNRLSRGLPRPLEVFHAFPRLPDEPKIKIFELACNEPRVIEMEIGPDLDEVTGGGMGSHQWRRVCPRSRIPPPLFFVNSLAREVVESIYDLRTFDTLTRQNTERYMYFNKKVDILYFGEGVCISVLIRTMKSGAVRQGIPKVAIVCSNEAEMCCGESWDEPTYGIDGGISTMQALHGFDKSICDYPDWTVDAGLKDVYFMIKSNLWRRGPGDFNHEVTMRPATNEGLTQGQITFKNRMMANIHLIENGTGLAGVGENMWVGDKKPDFHFMNFCPKTKGIDKRIYDAMCVPRAKINSLKSTVERNKDRRGEYIKYEDLEFVKFVEASTGCKLTIPEPDYFQQDPREIGFFGTRAEVERAKAAIKNRVE